MAAALKKLEEEFVLFNSKPDERVPEEVATAGNKLLKYYFDFRTVTDADRAQIRRIYVVHRVVLTKELLLEMGSRSGTLDETIPFYDDDDDDQ